jgi:hypothetical protein
VPADLIYAAREHKDELRALAGEPELPPSATIWSGDDYRAFYDRRQEPSCLRAGQSQKAEAFAYECAVLEWLNRIFEPSPPGHCVYCGRGERKGDALLPVALAGPGCTKAAGKSGMPTAIAVSLR